MAGAEPSDTGVVRLPIAGDEPKRNIDLAALFDLAAGEHTQAVGVQKQREDHARVVAGPASRFATSCGERSQIETGDRVEHCRASGLRAATHEDRAGTGTAALAPTACS
jgi:hypothetical protein